MEKAYESIDQRTLDLEETGLACCGLFYAEYL